MKPEDADPIEFARDLGAKLASRSRHVCLFLGAGTSKACGLPDLRGLQEAVLERLEEPDTEKARGLFEGRNIEEVLSRLRRIAALLEGDESLGGFSVDEAVSLDARICRAIAESVDISEAELEPFVRLGSWVARSDYVRAVEMFTVNYDLLPEAGLEAVGVPFFDGFVGSLSARFRADLVEPVDPTSSTLPPAGFTRLWKLHGATNWSWDQFGDHREIVRKGSVIPGEMVAIYPSEEKYEESRRMPFVVLMDRFRRALAEPETLFLVSGYSFSDEHLNEMFFDAATRHPRSEVDVFFFEDVPEPVKTRAMRTPNLIVSSPDGVIRGGIEKVWAGEEPLSDVWDGKRFLLGDFGHLASFLSKGAGEPNVGA